MELIEKAINAIQSNGTELTEKAIKTIKSDFPIPTEHKIIWADVVFSRRISGLVITNNGIFIKGSESLVDEENAVITTNNKKIKAKAKLRKEEPSNLQQKINSIYHYVKWAYFDIGDFKISKSNDGYTVSFNNKTILKCLSGGEFFGSYNSIYTNMTQASAVTYGNAASGLEAVFVESNARVFNKTGHGVLAEQANNYIDKLKGFDAKVVGGDNAKNGADRIVNGIEIQSKYCSSAWKTIDRCFGKNGGNFKYYGADGNPMLVEVPKDQYLKALEVFKTKISEGKVPGVTNPNDAGKYIKQGNITYKQALNIAKPGNIDSLIYDARTGIVSCGIAAGISVIVTYAMCLYKSNDKLDALKIALLSGIKVFGISFATHILTQQLARDSISRNLLRISDFVVKNLGKDATRTIVNSLRSASGKKAIGGVAASKHLSKILRNNAITKIVTIAAFSIEDTFAILNNHISGAQYTKNMLSLVGSMLAAEGGILVAGAVCAKYGGAVGSTGGPIGVAAGVVGGTVAGVIGGTAIKYAGDYFTEDDSIILSRLFNAILINLVYDYMLNEQEIKDLIEKLGQIKPKQFRKLFKFIHSSKNQEQYIEEWLGKHINPIVNKRQKLLLPSSLDVAQAFTELIKDDNK